MSAAAILGQLAGEAAGGIFGGLGDLVNKVRTAITGVESLSSSDRASIETTLLSLETKLLELQSTVVKAQQSIIVAEAQGGSWLQRNWRPLVMMMFASIICNNYIIYPYLSLFWDKAPLLETPPELWSLMKLGLSGYVVGRSAEKCVKYYSERNK